MAAAYGQAISCDYLFIVEDILAAGAKCSGEPSAISSLVAEDYVKFIDDIVIAIMIETETLADDIEEALKKFRTVFR